MWRLGEQAEEAGSSAWNNKMIVFSAKLIDHIPRWAICLLKGHPGPGKVERREPRAVVTARPGQPWHWGRGVETEDGMGHGVVQLDRQEDSVLLGKPDPEPNTVTASFLRTREFSVVTAGVGKG